MPDRRCGARGFWIAVSLTHNPPVLERRSGSRSVADTLESAFRTHGKASISTRVRSTNGRFMAVDTTLDPWKISDLDKGKKGFTSPLSHFSSSVKSRTCARRPLLGGDGSVFRADRPPSAATCLAMEVSFIHLDTIAVSITSVTRWYRVNNSSSPKPAPL